MLCWNNIKWEASHEQHHAQQFELAMGTFEISATNILLITTKTCKSVVLTIQNDVLDMVKKILTIHVSFVSTLGGHLNIE